MDEGGLQGTAYTPLCKQEASGRSMWEGSADFLLVSLTFTCFFMRSSKPSLAFEEDAGSASCCSRLALCS